MEQLKINGPIYPVVAWGMNSVNRLSPVEVLKLVAIIVFRPATADKHRMVANWAIDCFVIGKWSFLLLAWVCAWNGAFVVAVIVYLLVMNLFSYFWHHLWLHSSRSTTFDDQHRDRRRFVNLLLAIAFSTVTYGYLYDRIFHQQFDWPPNIIAPIAALTFSIGNALTGMTGDLRPKTTAAYALVTTQLAMTFIFVAMLLNNSIPSQHRTPPGE